MQVRSSFLYFCQNLFYLPYSNLSISGVCFVYSQHIKNICHSRNNYSFLIVFATRDFLPTKVRKYLQKNPPASQLTDLESIAYCLISRGNF